MAIPPPCPGRFYDGRSAVAHEVHVVVNPQTKALEVSGPSLDLARCWPLSDLRAVTGQARSDAQLVLTCHAPTQDESPRDLARLVITEMSLVDWLKNTQPDLHRSDLRKGTRRRVALTAGAAVTAVALLLFVILPAMANTLAGLIPVEREIALGKSVTAQMERLLGGAETAGFRCTDPAGHAALDAMAARLVADQSLPYDLSVEVFDHEMINAFAAPGGQVVLFRGLLESASDPDAVAAVLAHEIGHVVARDPTRVALRSVGSAGLLSLVLGDVTGGAFLVFLGEQLLNTSYSREAEVAADRYALEMLDTAQVSADGLAAFFASVAEMVGTPMLPEALSSHPDLDGRAARARAFAAEQGPTTPALSNKDWRALQAICG